jgi:hypothetical protein
MRHLAAKGDGARPARAARAAAAAVVLGLAGALIGPVLGLINLNYTPLDLINQTDCILRAELGPVGPKGECPVKAARALKGKAPETLMLQANIVNEQLSKPLKKAFGAQQTVPALVFISGDLSKASINPDEPLEDKPCGAVYIGTHWFGLYKKQSGPMLLDEDKLTLRAVWAGGNEMLERVVEYALAETKRAYIPVADGVSWGSDVHLGTIEGRVNGCLVVEPAAGGKPCLFVMAERGDRLYQMDAEGKQFLDLTDKMKLASKSLAAAWGDFNGDGRLDLASWDGASLRIYLQGADGALAPAAAAAQLAHGCTHLAAIDVGKGRVAGLLVSAAGAPEVVSFDGAGKAEVCGLPPASGKAAEGLDEAGPCAAADLDGDGLTDVVQLRTGGALFYKGLGGGRFEPPARALEARLGRRLTAVFCGDVDGDGLLDLVVTCDFGSAILNNRGGGRFATTTSEAGELDYIGNKDGINALGGAICDINNDGRQDVALFYPAMGFMLFFNRGFRCFGHALTLDLERVTLKGAAPAKEGQQGGTIADFNGDGAQDVAFVTSGGEVWVFLREAEKGPRLGATVVPPPDCPGPLVVTAAEGGRRIGAQRLIPGAPAFFGKRQPGPLTLSWRAAGGPEQSKTVAVINKPVRLDLPAAEPAGSQRK